MRYIKLFEHFGTGYTILDGDYLFPTTGIFSVMWDQRRNSYFREKTIDISQKYIKDIEKLDWVISNSPRKKWNIKLSISYHPQRVLINKTYDGWDESTIPSVQLCGIHFEIIELEDEWFIVTIPTGNSKNPKGAKEIIWTTYKCDQWDSVIRLFKDKVLSK